MQNINKITTFTTTLKRYDKVAIITQIWHRPKSLLHASAAHGTMYLIMVPNMKKIHLAIMHEDEWLDGLMDRWTDCLTDRQDPFLHSYSDPRLCIGRAGNSNM